MDEMENAVVEPTEIANHAVAAFEAQAEKANAQGFAAAHDMGDKMRAMFTKSLHEARSRYTKTKSAATEASTALETSLGVTRQGVALLNVKAIEAMKSDADAHFDLVTSMLSVKSVSDVITLNSEFVRKRFEEATVRAKSFSEMARQIAEEAATPIREQIAKSAKFAS